MEEVAELTQQLEDAQTQVENLLRATEKDRPSNIWADYDRQYPKLRARNSSYSNLSENPHYLDVGVRSLDESQCSDAHISSSSEENFLTLADFQEKLRPANSSPPMSISLAQFTGDDIHEKDLEEHASDNLGHFCKEVQCIEVEDSSTNRDANSSTLQYTLDEYSSLNFSESTPSTCAYSNVLDTIPNGYAGLNFPSPTINTGTSGLTEVGNIDRAHPEPCSPQVKEQNQLKRFCSVFVMPSPEKPSPWLLEEGSFSSRSMKLTRSRSCRARIISNLPTIWLDKLESNASTPPIGFGKDFCGRPENSQMKGSALDDGVDSERLSKRGSWTLVDSDIDVIKRQSAEIATDMKNNIVSKSDAAITCMTNELVQGAKPKDATQKNVKDVGLDPIQDDVEVAPKWPSEFKRLQREIIELWHACNVSLVHRSYFFLLFKGDPSDSFYLEVELRRLSFLKETFSRGHKTMVDGHTLTPASSMRALNQERQMLSRKMQNILATEEREHLFLKWVIPLNGNHRRQQLAQRIWTKTTDMTHIIESATLVARLVGFQEQEQALREMFGLLNFAPKRPSRRKSYIWQQYVKSLL